MNINKEKAMELLHANMQDNNLRKHCYAVGFAMSGIFNYLKDKGCLGNDGTAEDWEILGILHDSDYELTKNNWNEHTLLTLQWLKELGVEEEDTLYKGMASHNNKITHLRSPETKMEWALECVDELTGFIIAVVLIRPEKELCTLTVESIKKKWKQPAFAKNVSRVQIEQCEDKLGIGLDDFIEITLKALTNNAQALGFNK